MRMTQCSGEQYPVLWGDFWISSCLSGRAGGVFMHLLKNTWDLAALNEWGTGNRHVAVMRYPIVSNGFCGFLIFLLNNRTKKMTPNPYSLFPNRFSYLPSRAISVYDARAAGKKGYLLV
jgi:hypothetical protein